MALFLFIFIIKFCHIHFVSTTINNIAKFQHSIIQ